MNAHTNTHSIYVYISIVFILYIMLIYHISYYSISILPYYFIMRSIIFIYIICIYN